MSVRHLYICVFLSFRCMLAYLFAFIVYFACGLLNTILIYSLAFSTEQCDE